MKVAVVGTGTMGMGIGQVFAMAGDDVAMCIVTGSPAEPKKAKFDKTIAKLVEKGKIDQAKCDDVCGRVKFGPLEELAKDADLVIESAVEELPEKIKVFDRLKAVCKPDAMFATNTSSISITEIQSLIGRDLIGMHFFNPAAVMKLIEVIPGLNTPEEMTKKIVEKSEAVGKTVVLVKDGPGFVVNRVLIPMINEAISILADGLATAEDIDTAMKLGANHPMGPLALADLIGNDVCLEIMDVLYHETGDTKYRADYLLRKMVRAGKLGRKSGAGFFDYSK